MPWQHEWIAALGATARQPPGLAMPRDVARFTVYRASYEANLTQALADTYPVILRLVGADFFGQTARAYLLSHRSRCGDIHAWGGGFGDFLQRLAACAAHPWMPDVARLEWCTHEAFHAAEAVPLSREYLATLPAEMYAGLRLLPSVRLLHTDWPIQHIWQVNQEDWPGEATVDLAEGGGHLAVWRDGLEIAVRDLPDTAFMLAREIDTHGDFGVACEVYREPDQLGEALHALIEAGLVAAPLLHKDCREERA